MPGFFCPEGSDVPTACPPGTWSGNETQAEANCSDCPVGYRCIEFAQNWTHQSAVYLDTSGRAVVGTGVPELCDVDRTPVHYSYPDFQGCEESCPYEYPRQSYCHVAGDGRIPERDRLTLFVSDFIAKRSTGGLTVPIEQDQALRNLSQELTNMSAADRQHVLAFPDRNGRPPLILAAMLGDVPLLEVLWQGGAGAVNTTAARDLDGFTALMHALRLGNDPAASWLVAQSNASLSAHDASVLEGFGVDLTGVPLWEFQQAPEYLGNGGLAWTHPSGEDFIDSPLADVVATYRK